LVTHVFVAVPAYNADPAHDAKINAAYAAHLPAKSEAAVAALVALQIGDRTPIAQEIDTHFTSCAPS
jgi:hypothetical protein